MLNLVNVLSLRAKVIAHTDNAKGLIDTRFRHTVYKMLLVMVTFAVML
jgi:hypothetical protein